MSDNCPSDTSGFWFSEDITPDVATKYKLKSISVSGQTKFQKVQIIETVMGKTLVLDSKTQSAKLDEHIYHESLVHAAMLTHPNPKTVFIGGGGEMATAREVLKHKSVEKVIMVDIDQEVVEFCLKHMPEWSNGSHNDPRLEIIFDDANAYLKQYQDKFDIIIMDICDPIEAGPGIVCYFKSFYERLITKMSDNGVFVTQAGPGGFLTHGECHSVICNTLGSVFDNTFSSTVEIPSFGSPWSFVIAYNNHETLPQNILERDIDEIDNLIEKRIDGSLRFYDGHGHRHAHYLSKYLRDSIKNERRIMTEETPVFMY